MTAQTAIIETGIRKALGREVYVAINNEDAAKVNVMAINPGATGNARYTYLTFEAAQGEQAIIDAAVAAL